MVEKIILSQEWVIGQQLKEGGFGKVYLARSQDGMQAVIKLIPKDPGAERELLFEDLGEVPNVMPILDSGEWGDYWILVMPKAEKSLRDHLGEMGGVTSVENTLQILVDIVQALVGIEDRVVHRDIKPENILLLNGHWCLADFGISRYAEATTAQDTRKFAMTEPYAAPEQWRRERATSATDVYAMGIVAYELLAGQRPFLGPDYRHQHLEENPAPIPDTPPRFQSLINQCLYKGPQARPKPQSLLRQLKESMQPASAAAQRLQQANSEAVRQQAERDRQESVARSESERRFELSQAARQSLEHVVGLLRDQILANAPAGELSGGLAQWAWALCEGRLSVEPSRVAESELGEASYRLPFEVVAYSSMSVTTLQERYGYKGRSHSLWYCDAQAEGAFRWYETAFMISPLLSERSRLRPFALDPGKEACIAIMPGINENQVAWPFTPIDQGNENDFIERWMDWFAQAAQGGLSPP